MNLATALELAVHRYPGATAIVTNTGSYTYLEWDRRIDSVAWSLVTAGIRPGDHVAICALNGEAPATMYFAIHKTGAVAVMLNARWKHRDITYVLDEANVGGMADWVSV
ncbi:MAG: acyl--CoA ligase [Dethiobacter sp.]|nr:acyl--CoA ligase [Dethiobacter sp.]